MEIYNTVNSLSLGVQKNPNPKAWGFKKPWFYTQFLILKLKRLKCDLFWTTRGRRTTLWETGLGLEGCLGWLE